jgi:hypothetical protein
MRRVICSIKIPPRFLISVKIPERISQECGRIVDLDHVSLEFSNYQSLLATGKVPLPIVAREISCCKRVQRLVEAIEIACRLGPIRDGREFDRGLIDVAEREQRAPMLQLCDAFGCLVSEQASNPQVSLRALPLAQIQAPIFLSLTLKSVVSRWTNVILGSLYAVSVLLSCVGETWVYYIFLSVAESALFLLIVWYAWKWSKQA